MVLNADEIKKAISSGDIVITRYTWNGQDPVSKILQSGDLKNGHKIKLHVGYVLRTLSDNKWIDPKNLFNEHDGIVDLRSLKNRQYKLLPGETVLIFTNEVLEFGKDYFGLVLSRVSHEETGLIVSSTYVDPNWAGVLQLVVTNRLETPQLLQEYCEIANLIICKMSAPSTDSKENKNGHYGLDWDIISKNPAKRLWNDRSRKLSIRIRHKIRTYWVLFTGLSITAFLIILYNIVNIFYSLYSIYKEIFCNFPP